MVCPTMSHPVPDASMATGAVLVFDSLRVTRHAGQVVVAGDPGQPVGKGVLLVTHQVIVSLPP